MTASSVSEQAVVLSVGDTTFLDYGKIVAKRDGYGPQGRGGNGLAAPQRFGGRPRARSTLGTAVAKVVESSPSPQAPADETPEQKKQRQAKERKAKRARAFEEKDSYRWVEAMAKVEKLVALSTRVIHVFDREGDIAEVFDQINQLTHAGVVVRARHDRSLEKDPHRLWETLEAPAHSGLSRR